MDGERRGDLISLLHSLMGIVMGWQLSILVARDPSAIGTDRRQIK
jgi:hypothetical protein